MTGNRLLADENAAAAASWSDSTATLNMHAAAQTASVAAALQKAMTYEAFLTSISNSSPSGNT